MSKEPFGLNVGCLSLYVSNSSLLDTCLNDYVNLWGKPLTVIHNLAMFGGHWTSASGDIKYLKCRVTSENHVIEG